MLFGILRADLLEKYLIPQDAVEVAASLPATYSIENMLQKESPEMKILRYLVALALALGLTSVAKADDFHMIVVDPIYSTDFPIEAVTNLSTLPILFFECEEPDQLPASAGSTYDGCFTFINKTGQTLTSLTINVNGNVPGQTAGCDLSLIDGGANISIFSSAPVCSTSANSYTLVFTDGMIVPGETVTIAEGGVVVLPPPELGQPLPPNPFPSTTATFTAETPEPSSLSLIGTGTLMLGSLLIGRRRSALLPTRR